MYPLYILHEAFEGVTMQVTLNIPRRNSERAMRLLHELLQLEGEEDDARSPPRAHRKAGPLRSVAVRYGNLLAIPTGTVRTTDGRLDIGVRGGTIGAPAMFNSYLPVKALLRAVLNISEQGGGPVTLAGLKNACKAEFLTDSVVTNARGFPLPRDPEGSINHLIRHFGGAAVEMALLTLDGKVHGKEIPEIPRSERDWEGVHVYATPQGRDFALTENDLFDKGGSSRVLNQHERQWIVNYLESIDAQGYKEFSTLRNSLDFLRRTHDGRNLKQWFKSDPGFVSYARRTSSQTGKVLDTTLDSLSATFAASKLAILRELGAVADTSGDYLIVGDLTDRKGQVAAACPRSARTGRGRNNGDAPVR